MSAVDLTFARRFPAECTEAVYRTGTSEPCGHVAVAVRRDPEDGDPYPVCVKHTRNISVMVPLADLLEGAP
jgi:hypothetical protein